MFDMKTNVKTLTAIKPVAAGTTGTGQVGKVIDRRGYGSLTFLIAVGEITATAATVTPRIMEGDTTGSLTSVADADLIGTEAEAAVGGGARASGTTKNVTKRIGYKGNKRYVRCSLINTASAGILVSAQALLGHPEMAPVTS